MNNLNSVGLFKQRRNNLNIILVGERSNNPFFIIVKNA